MGVWSQISLLLWKNWLQQKRRPCVSVFEVIMPVASALLILALRGILETKNHSMPEYFQNASVALTRREFTENASIGFTPNISETNILMDNLLQLLKTRTGRSEFSIEGFSSEDEALGFIKLNPKIMQHLIVFNSLNPPINQLPKHLSFTIRPYTDNDGDEEWHTDLTFPFYQTGTPREPSDLYKERGVLFMQSLVGEALARYWLQIDGKDPNSTLFDVYTNRMPYPPYVDDNMIQVVQTQLPFFLILSFILSVIMNTKNLIYEKERKLKESMKLMGLTPTALWISWFITFSIYIIPVMAIYTILCCINITGKGPVLAQSDGSLFFVFLLCYALSMITFCFMVSTFVQKANAGAAIAGIFYFVLYIPFNFIQPRYEGLEKGPKIASSLLFNCAMSLAANCFGIYEGTGEGAQWNNFYKPATTDDNLSLLECMIMLLVDSVIHALIAWYLDNIFPGEFGVPKPLYFCFTKSYWCGATVVMSDDRDSQLPQNKYFEKDPTNKTPGIRICNLKKKFGNKLAVVGTSMNMYEGQITVVLGHNGAGKTTTMSMLTGFIPPSSGTAIVNGYDIRDSIDEVRHNLGLCPQHNILFDTLTVLEHLEFFARLKGSPPATIQTEIHEMARKVGLADKATTRSFFLSGGQKRKLSVGIALIGGSKVVILDEPTSGMDPAARRETWNVLQEARQGRTIVLTTHFMDEADLLGDRIAIMAGGAVKCCGSSMFLKKLYGTGYHLVIVKKPDCNVDILTRAIQTAISTCELETIINTEVSYLLPDSESSKFPSLFHYLEVNKEHFGIISFGTSATTMEEVFIKVGDNEYEEVEDVEKSEDDEEDDNSRTSRNGLVKTDEGHVNPSFLNEATNFCIHEGSTTHGTFATDDKTNGKVDMSNVDIMGFNKGFTKKTGFALEISRMYALFIKKALHSWRNRIITIIQLLLPVLFTIFGMIVSETLPQGKEDPPLTFDLSPFDTTYIPFTDGVNATQTDSAFAEIYKRTLNTSQYMEYFKLQGNATFDNYTVKRTEEMGTPTYNKKMIIGMEVLNAWTREDIAAVAFYNGQPYHAQPISVNYLVNALLQSTLNNSYSLQSTVYPLPKDAKSAAEDTISSSLLTGFTVGYLISFGMSFVTTLFIFFLIRERQVGAKHMQVLSGVGPVTYWLPTLLWDFISYFVPSLLLLVVFAAFGKTAYLDEGRFALVILVLIMYGWAILAFTYAFQFLFSSPPTGVVVVIVLSIFSGLITTLAVFILQIPGLGTEKIGNALDWVFMVLFPNYNLATCFSNIYSNYLYVQYCEPLQPMCAKMQTSNPCCKDTCGSTCINFESNYADWNKPGIGAPLLFMAIQGAFFFTIVMLIEYHMFQKFWYIIRGPPKVDQTGHDNIVRPVEDSDVAAERERINSAPASVLSHTDSLLLVNLYKRYNDFVAVDHTCLGIPEQECFGLLGQNGAGKTTTFKMLTGDVMVTDGNAYLKGFDVKSNIKQVQANLGYCPQFDALIDQMTGRETLVMYARLRGIPKEYIKMVVNSIIDILMLRPHADKLTSQYSGGNKRKLSTAIALIGDPPFIMLDEPSSGMDPKAKRNLWNVLSQVRASGRTLVLTSHSMEECDALCTRIAIMVNGKFVCLGSPQHLKNKFGQGYTLITQLGNLPDGSPAPNQPVIDFLAAHFPGCKVFDDHQGYVHFQVPDSTIKLADVFYYMETTKQNLYVEDYSVHQTTLEQIFLTFTKAQNVSKHGN